MSVRLSETENALEEIKFFAQKAKNGIDGGCMSQLVAKMTSGSRQNRN